MNPNIEKMLREIAQRDAATRATAHEAAAPHIKRFEETRHRGPHTGSCPCHKEARKD